MGVTITKKAVQPIALEESLEDEVLAEVVGLAAPKGGVTIVKKALFLPINSAVVLINEWAHVPYYRKGDKGIVTRSVRVDSPYARGRELDLYEIRMDNPRVDRDGDLHEKVLLRRWEIEAA